MKEIHEPDVNFFFQIHFINMRTNKTFLYLKITLGRISKEEILQILSIRHSKALLTRLKNYSLFYIMGEHQLHQTHTYFCVH